MKIRCDYCGNMFNDTQDVCPYCGAPSTGVKRSASVHPKTIRELQDWYSAKGLPPAETTRFFIGVDYKKPRAFGIYQDPKSGNFVVYKNKDTGVRAIRYEGTDEAYAVNELYQRLKQEIIQQKSNQLGKKNAGLGKKGKKEKSLVRSILEILLFIFVVVIVLPVSGFVILGSILIFMDQKPGYYDYNGQIYYNSDHYPAEDHEEFKWFLYTEEGWSDPLDLSEDPVFGKKSTCKKYFLDKEWNESIPCTDFKDSIWAKDIEADFYPGEGYYQYEDTFYYHLAIYYWEDWYCLEKEWQPVSFEDLPEDLQHTSLMPAYSKGLLYEPENDPDWIPFRDTVFYADYQSDKTAAKGYYVVDDHYYYHLADSYEDGWYSYEDNDWSQVDEADLPEAFSHPSMIDDFYYLDKWDDSTQFTDFTDSEIYKEDKDLWEEDSDSDSSWSSSDSWDSSSTDFSSDW